MKIQIIFLIQVTHGFGAEKPYYIFEKLPTFKIKWMKCVLNKYKSYNSRGSFEHLKTIFYHTTTTSWPILEKY